jgi:MOSC domain-containing protein
VYVKELWRYPVKSMAGEQLESARLTLEGIEGDRGIRVQNEHGRTVTSRRYPGLLGFRATLDRSVETLIDGSPWTDPNVLGRVQEIVGSGARLVRDDGLDRFDVLPLLVATDGAIAEFGRDRRRLRPNIVVGDVAGLEERTWEGEHLLIGDAVIAVQDLRDRCIMTTFDPDTLAHDPKVLRDIVRRFEGKLALNCSVERGGEIQANQKVRIVRATQEGWVVDRSRSGGVR